MFHKRHPHIGARPGTLVISVDSPPPTLRFMRYQRSEFSEGEIESIEEFANEPADGTVRWIDVHGYGDQAMMKRIGDAYHLHPLALESIINVPQRPKVEVFDEQLLVIVRMIRLVDESKIDIEQVSIVVGKDYVITFQERSGDVFDPVRKRIRMGNTIRKHGSDFLAYAIIDAIVDAYYPVLEGVGDYLESIEDAVISNPTPALLGELHRMKNQLTNLRRAIWPQREAVLSLIHEDHDVINEGVRMYFRDTYDHCIQTTEVAEMYREMMGGLLNTYLSAIANRTNDVMKILTIVATIFIPLTFLAGIYGMNFEHMPELKYTISYPLFWAIILTVGVTMTYFFWKRGWLNDSHANLAQNHSSDDR